MEYRQSFANICIGNAAKEKEWGSKEVQHSKWTQTQTEKRKKRIARISIRVQGRNTQEKVGPITMQYSKLSEGIWSFLSPSWLVLMNCSSGWTPASHTLQRKSWGQTCIHTNLHSSVNMTKSTVYKYFFVWVWRVSLQSQLYLVYSCFPTWFGVLQIWFSVFYKNFTVASWEFVTCVTPK